MLNVSITKIRYWAAVPVFSNWASGCVCARGQRPQQPGLQMLRFLLFAAVLTIIAYATLGGGDLSDIIKFGLVLLIALCAAAIYAGAARAKRRNAR